MKNLKKIVAAILSVAMLGAIATTSFAASLDYTNEIEFSATVSPATVAPGEDVTISFYMKDITNNETLTMAAGGSYGVNFSVSENLTYKSSTIGQDFGTESLGNTLVNGYYVTLLEPTEEANVTADAPIFTYVFTVNADATGTFDAITGWADPYVGDGDGMEAGDYSYDASAAKITVAAGEEEGPKATAGTTTTDGKITEYTFEGTDAIEKVLLFNEKVAGSAITEATRFKVTSGTRSQIFGGDIWAKLGAEGDGEVSVENVVFGLIVTAANNAADFTFEIVK